MDIANRKGFVKIGIGTGFIVVLAVLVLFLSSITPAASPTDLSGQVTGSMMDEAFGGGQGTNGNSPVLIDVTSMGDGNGETTPYTISGKVIDLRTGNGVSGATFHPIISQPLRLPI